MASRLVSTIIIIAFAGFVLVNLQYKISIKNAEKKDHYFTLQGKNSQRGYFLFQSDRDESVPLVIAFHSRNENALWFSGRTGLMKAAKEKGCHIVFLEAQGEDKAGRGSAWDDGFPLGQGKAQVGKDVAFTEALISDLKSRLHISKIFITGYGTGAGMAMRAGAELNTEVDAVATVAGHFWKPPASFSKPVSLLRLVGDVDSETPLEAKMVSWRWLADKSSECPPAIKDVEEWAALNKCDKAIQKRTEGDITYTEMKHCDGEKHVLFGVIAKQGHGWPGATSQNFASANEPSNASVDATKIIFEFFANE